VDKCGAKALGAAAPFGAVIERQRTLARLKCSILREERKYLLALTCSGIFFLTWMPRARECKGCANFWQSAGFSYGRTFSSFRLTVRDESR